MIFLFIFFAFKLWANEDLNEFEKLDAQGMISINSNTFTQTSSTSSCSTATTKKRVLSPINMRNLLTILMMRVKVQLGGK